MGYGPAVAWVSAILLINRDRLGSWRALAFAIFTGLGILGLTALVLAWLPATVERLGFERFGAWLRRFWDEDAR